MIIKETLEKKYKYIGITAFKIEDIPPINELFNEIKTLSNNYESEIQLLNANRIATWKHLFFSGINALKSFEGNYNLSSSIAMETLLYVAGNRQIRVALDRFGVKLGVNKIAVIIFTENKETVYKINDILKNFLKGKENQDLLNLNEEKYKDLIELFTISPIEITNLINAYTSKFKLLTKIIIDRGAMVSLEK
ncbi:MAG: KEOPS complex subunit Cgi121 [Candidatus Helarchaeota archaeon]